MRRIVRLAAVMTVAVGAVAPAPPARAFIGGVLACEFDPTSTACIARQIALLQQAEAPGPVKDRAGAFLSYAWARRGQAVYARSMEGAPKDQRLRAWAAVMARAELGDYATARRAAGYIRIRDLWVTAHWLFAMSALRRGATAEAERLLPALLEAQARQTSPFPAVESRCRIAMVQATLNQAEAAKTSLAAARAAVEAAVPVRAARPPLLVACATATAAVEDRAAAQALLAAVVATLDRDTAMPQALRLVFLAQAAEQWTRLGDAARSQALARRVIGEMGALTARRRLMLLEYLFLASFRTPAK